MGRGAAVPPQPPSGRPGFQQMSQEWVVIADFFQPGCLAFIVKSQEARQEGMLVFGDKEFMCRFFSWVVNCYE